MDAVEGEDVARQVNRNRESTRIDANLGGLDCQVFASLGVHSPFIMQVVDFHDFSGFFSWFWRPSAVRLHFSIFPKQLMQVVDFHNSFRYFQVPRFMQWSSNPSELPDVFRNTRTNLRLLVRLACEKFHEDG